MVIVSVGAKLHMATLLHVSDNGVLPCQQWAIISSANVNQIFSKERAKIVCG